MYFVSKSKSNSSYLTLAMKKLACYSGCVPQVLDKVPGFGLHILHALN